MIPRKFSSSCTPCIVNDFPEPVWPLWKARDPFHCTMVTNYAKMVPLYPSKHASQMGLPTILNTPSCVLSMLPTASNENMSVLLPGPLTTITFCSALQSTMPCCACSPAATSRSIKGRKRTKTLMLWEKVVKWWTWKRGALVSSRHQFFTRQKKMCKQCCHEPFIDRVRFINI